MALDDSHPQSPPANVTAKVTAPTLYLIPPSSALTTASAITQIPVNSLKPTPFPIVPLKSLFSVSIHTGGQEEVSAHCVISNVVPSS